MVCLSADQFAENLLESSGADAKRSKLEGRSGILTWKWILEYLDHLWLHVQMKGCRQQRHSGIFPQYLHLHLRQKFTCRNASTGSARESTQDQSILVRELLDARHARLPVWGSHILVNASRIKMPGKIAAEQHQRRSRNVELVEIWTHDRWTEFEFNRSRAEEDKNNLCDRQQEFGEPNG